MKKTLFLCMFSILAVGLKAQVVTGDTAAIRKFEMTFKQWGGRIKSIKGSLYESYLLQARSMMQNIQPKDPKYPIPYIDFVDTTAFNASATRFESQYLIGIYKGAVEVINELCIRLMANNKTFIRIGTPSKEKNLNKISLSEIYNPGRRNSGHYTFAFPVDPIRGLYAQELIITLYRNLIFHEYCHIRHGHIAYRESLSLLPLKEISDSSSPSFSTLDSQTIEMDADSYAGAETLSTILQYVKNPKLVPATHRRFYKNWQTAFQIWVAAIYIQWRSLSFLNVQSNFQTVDHPLPGLRLKLILPTVYEIFDRSYKTGLDNEITKILVNTVDDIEFAFSQISLDPLDYSNVKFMLSQEALLQVKRIMNNWNHLRPLLLKYSYSPLAPPYVDD